MLLLLLGRSEICGRRESYEVDDSGFACEISGKRKSNSNDEWVPTAALSTKPCGFFDSGGHNPQEEGGGDPSSLKKSWVLLK